MRKAVWVCNNAKIPVILAQPALQNLVRRNPSLFHNSLVLNCTVNGPGLKFLLLSTCLSTMTQTASSPKFRYRWESTGYSMINELCRHNYGHRNLGHGRFRPEVLRHWYFYMMGVMGCVHKVNSRTFHTLMLGEILFSIGESRISGRGSL